MDPDRDARELSAQSQADGDATGWFERLYVASLDGGAVVPWDRAAPSQLLVQWAQQRQLSGAGRSALVVGCGLGRDAEYVAGLGYDTVAFDISPTAVRTAQLRHPDSPVRYVTADLLDPPEQWLAAHDLVVESMTVQALPDPPRRAAIHNVGRLVKPAGTLIVLAAAKTEANAVEPGPPWPLARDEIEAFTGSGLNVVEIAEIPDSTDPTVVRWRAEFRRPALT